MEQTHAFALGQFRPVMAGASEGRIGSVSGRSAHPTLKLTFDPERSWIGRDFVILN